MNVLDLDVGNSRLKWRYGSVARLRGAMDRSREVADAFPADVRPERIRVSSVAGSSFNGVLSDALSERFGIRAEFARVSSSLGGVTCGYEAPDQLGVDRWLAVVAAWQRYRRPAVVVDAGSACTIDLLGEAGVHQGGYIVPGLEMMVAALYARTAQVKVTPRFGDGCLAPGRRTEDAVLRGAIGMLADFVSGCASRLAERGGTGEPVIVIGGGDAKRLSAVVERPTEICEDLVFEGLAVALP